MLGLDIFGLAGLVFFLVNQQGWSQGCVKVCVNLQMLSAMTNAATPRLSLPFRGPEVT